MQGIRDFPPVMSAPSNKSITWPSVCSPSNENPKIQHRDMHTNTRKVYIKALRTI